MIRFAESEGIQRETHLAKNMTGSLKGLWSWQLFTDDGFPGEPHFLIYRMGVTSSLCASGDF